jgi:hypothetical protein
MSLLALEIPLALLGYRRGWRRAPAALLALPCAAAAFGAGLGVAHGVALLGLAVAASLDPAAPRRAGALYQI